MHGGSFPFVALLGHLHLASVPGTCEILRHGPDLPRVAIKRKGTSSLHWPITAGVEEHATSGSGPKGGPVVHWLAVPGCSQTLDAALDAARHGCAPSAIHIDSPFLLQGCRGRGGLQPACIWASWVKQAHIIREAVCDAVIAKAGKCALPCSIHWSLPHPPRPTAPEGWA